MRGRPVRYRLASWWNEGIEKYYLLKIWYYENWGDNSPSYSVPMAYATVTWGTWQECYATVIKEINSK